MSAKSSPSEWWVDQGPACRAMFESNAEGYEETTCWNVPVTDMTDAVQKRPRRQNHLLALEMFALASDHSLHRLVPTVHLEFLRVICSQALRERRLQIELGWDSSSPPPACTSCTSRGPLERVGREPR